MTAWTVGLFGAGTALARAVAEPWAEPLVLLALGLAFLFVSARMGRPAPRPVSQLPARASSLAFAPGDRPAAATAQAPAAAAVPVEQSA